MYLWHILSRDESELIHRVYKTQKNDNSVGDWFRLVEADKSELDINMSDMEIQGVFTRSVQNICKEIGEN